MIPAVYAQERTLPHYMTEAEKVLYQTYQPPVLFQRDINPPPVSVRAMAEWEELQGIMITWTSFQSIISQIVDYAQEEGLVYIVCSDSNSVKNYLTNQNIPLINLVFLNTSYNSIWIRDYGPWTAYSENTDSLFIIDWIYNRPRPSDDVIPLFFANFINVPIYQTTVPPNDLVHSGGNLMVDGHGTAFSSKLILQENSGKTEAEIDTIMKKYLGIDRYIKMQTLPYDVIHHIDMHVKLLDEETLLVGEYPSGIADGPQIEANLQYILNNFQTCYGRPYKVVRIPMPPDQSGHYPNSGGDYCTYTNSMIVNKTVIIPTYEYQYDTTAFRIYREAMPGYNIVGINSNSIIPLLGTIHCIVKEVGARNPIFISHASLENMSSLLTEYPIKAYIRTNNEVANAQVYWTTDTTQGFNALPMTAATNDTFECAIPAQPVNSKIFYYISVQSNSGKTITKPLTAPGGNYQFDVELITAISGDKVVSNRFILNQCYPNPFNPTTTIFYQVPHQSDIQIEIYNMLGQKIRTLLNDQKEPGEYKILWDGRNDSEMTVSSGVYLYRMVAGDFVQTRKMILMK
jgi:agmatine/peptidylarginine deiminase